MIKMIISTDYGTFSGNGEIEPDKQQAKLREIGRILRDAQQVPPVWDKLTITLEYVEEVGT